MKYIFTTLLFIYLFSLDSNAQNDLFWQNPHPQGNDLNDVFVINSQTAIAVGDQGIILRTSNGGLDWEIQYFLEGLLMDLVEIDFIDDQNGWILANEYREYDDSSSIILGTNDQGYSWNIILNLDSLRLNDLFFLNVDTGWVVGSNEILKTIDGGVSWQSLNAPGTGIISSIFFINQDEGWVAFNDSIYHTINGGQSWNFIFSYPYQGAGCCEKLVFTDIKKGWCVFQSWGYVGIGYSIAKTIDGGFTWTWPSDLQVSYYQYDFFFLNPDTGWVVADNQIFRTVDGGTNWWWHVSTNYPLEKARSVHFSNFYHDYSVGLFGTILKTDDGGVEWDLVSHIETTYDLNDIQFVNNDTGWVVGEFSYSHDGGLRYAGIILKTENGGVNWSEPKILGSGSYGISSVNFINEDVGYVSGANGLYKSMDGGSNWNPLMTGYLSDVFFHNVDTGFVAERMGSGKLYKTTDGGQSWYHVSDQNNSIESVYFLDELSGWAVGWETPILGTINGGETWNILSDSGWAVGTNHFSSPFQGIIAKSLDGGYNWSILHVSEDYKFNSVCFLDSLNGFVVGEEIHAYHSSSNNLAGIVLFSTDGGTTWNNYGNVAKKGLKKIFFVDDQTGWIVGGGGTILKTNTSGIVGINDESNTMIDIPKSFQLQQNYPNPFNPSTTIKYEIPKASEVKLKIYDILGSEIQTLVSEFQMPGNYSVNFDASKFSSGVLFYKLQAGSDFIKTKKMLLIK
ncbi:YCF48-related protein [Bacteroidota bacterium]